jgi:hypothetical protein
MVSAVCAVGSNVFHEGTIWWTLIEDLRTSLKDYPLDVELTRELLGETA